MATVGGLMEWIARCPRNGMALILARRRVNVVTLKCGPFEEKVGGTTMNQIAVAEEVEKV
jgi:hypothetical protein